MHIKSCLNPQSVRDVVTKQLRLVPCGKCAACLNRQSAYWVSRLEQERYSWKYCVFFTLTYAPEHLPQMRLLKGNKDWLVASTPELRPHSEPPLTIDLDEVYFKYCKDEHDKLKTIDWLNRVPYIGVVSSYHLSKFIKRFRTYAEREYLRQSKQDGFERFKREETSFRYFAIGEYGSTTLRPHYHGQLFFNSEWLAVHVEELITKSWKFGITDASFVADSNASYVAAYLNGISNLPAVYWHRKIRPFFLCSKFPPIGTLQVNSQDLCKIFLDGDIEFTLFDHSKGLFDNVPLWRTIKDRLYPRLSGFNQISHYERVALYRLAERFESFNAFYQFCLGFTNEHRPQYLCDYIDYLSANAVKFDIAMQRWYYISRRVVTQSLSFQISVSDYVTAIENYFNKCDYENLKRQYKFQNDYQDDGHSLSDLIGVDELFIRGFVGIDIHNVSVEDIDRLKSYGVDIDKFFSEDSVERSIYLASLLPDNSYDYLVFSKDSENWFKRRVKNKRKNDYLELHPEMQNFIF